MFIHCICHVYLYLYHMHIAPQYYEYMYILCTLISLFVTSCGVGPIVSQTSLSAEKKTQTFKNMNSWAIFINIIGDISEQEYAAYEIISINLAINKLDIHLFNLTNLRSMQISNFITMITSHNTPRIDMIYPTINPYKSARAYPEVGRSEAVASRHSRWGGGVSVECINIGE